MFLSVLQRQPGVLDCRHCITAAKAVTIELQWWQPSMPSILAMRAAQRDKA